MNSMIIKRLLERIVELRNEHNNISKPLKVKNLSQYRTALTKMEEQDIDLSKCNLDYEDIRDLNFENRGLDIDLRKIFVPYGGAIKYNNTVLRGIGEIGDVFLDLRNTNLKGNNVIGDLSFYETTGGYGREQVYTTYKKEMFDEDYIASYPEFFLDDNAPVQLKEKFYNPQEKICETVASLLARSWDSSKVQKLAKFFTRQEFTLKEYTQYYEYMKGKYLGNFIINTDELIIIQKIEEMGMQKTLEYLKKFSKDDPLPLYYILDSSINLLEEKVYKYSLNQKDMKK